ncbi:alkaline phosphatase family protein [Nafulsella turpanensis]|uniref:alkaline phosphatase family protein n=1 Tax=Nafulsella turpanensis TaxID=1265690 RepID=UPI001F1F3B02|nr:ectonucleotide pyrophosphatase/phosphodiesterase [Nafulsella turpanensis]
MAGSTILHQHELRMNAFSDQAYICYMYMKILILLFVSSFISLTSFAQGAGTPQQKVVAGRKNSAKQQDKPYIILISADGFRHDYAEMHGADNLLRLSKQGVQAASMIPSFPSKTFPNHYSIVTGLYPAHHGLVSNHFYDPERAEIYSPRNRRQVEDGSWYGGVPLWVLAEQQQMLSASFYWVGSEADINGLHPTYYYRYSEEIPMEERIQTVVNWLNLPEGSRPHLITFYLPEADHAGHRYGPEAPQTRQAVQFIDQSIQQLTAAVAETGLPVNYIFVSDHGMTAVDTAHTLSLPAVIDTSNFIVVEGDVMTTLYAKDTAAVRPTYAALKEAENGFTTYLTNQTPAHWHYNSKEDSTGRVGDILLLADWPSIFSPPDARRVVPGRHGYDPRIVEDMQATFYAWGPAFKEQLQISSFENVHLYPLIAALLELPYQHKIDGRLEVLEKVLKKPLSGKKGKK